MGHATGISGNDLNARMIDSDIMNVEPLTH